MIRIAIGILLMAAACGGADSQDLDFGETTLVLALGAIIFGWGLIDRPK